MKKFLVSVLFCIFCFCLIVAGLHILWIIITPHRMQRNFISNDIHTVVIGPSNGACSWIDTRIPHSQNFCSLAKSMQGCYNTLKWIVEYNEHQVDTVLLCATLQSMLFQHGDLKYAPFQEESAILDYDDFFNYSKKSFDYWKGFFTSFSYTHFHQKAFEAGYIRVDWNKTNDADLYKRVNDILSLVNGDKYGFTEEVIRKECQFQVYYFKRIVEYCNSHAKTLVIFCPPLAKIPDLIDDHGFRDFLASELPDSSLIVDYSRFHFPDSTYYGDLEHLNHKGALYFSDYIASDGLNFEYIIDYCEL